MSLTPNRGQLRRAGQLGLVVVAASTILIGAPAGWADATGHVSRRGCDPSATSATYTVVDGESWFSVARSSGVEARALLKVNDAGVSTVLHPGDVLCMPAGATDPGATPDDTSCASKHVIERGDSWFQLARGAGVSMSRLLKANDASATSVLMPGAEICLPAGAATPAATDPCISKRTVAAGESWYVISRSTGVPMPALYAANDSSSSSSLHPGQSLCLPQVGFGRGLRGTFLENAPVQGTCRFANSWMASRGGGRLHVGVDLIAPAGTPVLAAANGILTRQTRGSARAGNAWWLTTSSGTYFFYAHLSGFANGLKVGSQVHAGDVIGSVGSSGNAVSPHLHFELHPYGGGPVNPYDAIWMVGGCTYDRRYEQTPLS